MLSKYVIVNDSNGYPLFAKVHEVVDGVIQVDITEDQIEAYYDKEYKRFDSIVIDLNKELTSEFNQVELVYELTKNWADELKAELIKSLSS